MSALMYGRSSRSDMFGSRLFPMTLSISLCAASCISGAHIIARKNLQMEDAIYHSVVNTTQRGDIMRYQHTVSAPASGGAYLGQHCTSPDYL